MSGAGAVIIGGGDFKNLESALLSALLRKIDKSVSISLFWPLGVFGSQNEGDK